MNIVFVELINDLQELFNPNTIAVVGISRKSTSLGGKLMKNLIDFGYSGEIYPINPKANEIMGMKAYPSISSTPRTPDMVISLVPRDHVIPLMRTCGELGVKSVVIITAGFREVSEEGYELEVEIGKIARKNGIRIVGPNSMGIMNGHGLRMHATFSPVQCKEGSFSLISQSGALAAVVMSYVNEIKGGFSKVVSIGNKLDINENDLIEFFENDPDTKVILCYLESFSDPVNFIKSAKSAKKPIVVVKSGRTISGSRAAASHTGALAGNDNILSAGLRQSGVIRATTIKEMVDIAHFLEKAPLPQGNRVAIVTNAGGPGTLATDYSVFEGLEIAELTGSTLSLLKSILPPEATASNPADILPSATAETYAEVTKLLLKDPNVDTVVVLALPPVLIPLDSILNQLEKIDTIKPMIGIAMGCDQELKNFPDVSFPLYAYPMQGAKVLGKVTQYSLHQAYPEVEFKTIGSREIADYGVNIVQERIACSLEELKEICSEIGFPVVVKMHGNMHKTDIGGVFTDINSEEKAESAYFDIIEAYRELDIQDTRVLVQKQINNGVEAVIGVIKDPLFGPTIMIGSGGTTVELWKDVDFLPIPFHKEEVYNVIKNLKLYMMFSGYRGVKADIKKFVDQVMAVQHFVTENPDIQELDLNPVICTDNAAYAVDIRIKRTT